LTGLIASLERPHKLNTSQHTTATTGRFPSSPLLSRRILHHMTPQELIDHIQSGPWKLNLNFPLRFRRRTRSNPWCSFDDLLQALRLNKTIREVVCYSHGTLCITETDWIRLMEAFGSIRGLKKIGVAWRNGSHDFHPLQAVARAVDSSMTLQALSITSFGNNPSDPAGEILLVQSLQQHGTLEVFYWGGVPTQTRTRYPLLTAVDATLATSIHTVGVSNVNLTAGDIQSLVRSPRLKLLELKGRVDSWLVIADEIRNGRIQLEELVLVRTMVSSASETAEAIESITSAIEYDSSLRSLILRSPTGFTDEMGVALAMALTVNTSLNRIQLQDGYKRSDGRQPLHPPQSLGAETYKAFATLSKTRAGKITLGLPSPRSDANDETRKQWDLLRIEDSLNRAGVGKLVASNQPTWEEWIHALDALNGNNEDEDSHKFLLSCLYSMLQLNPSICQGDTTASDSLSNM